MFMKCVKYMKDKELGLCSASNGQLQRLQVPMPQAAITHSMESTPRSSHPTSL